MTLIDVQAALVLANERENDVRRAIELRRLIGDPAGRAAARPLSGAPVNRVWLQAFTAARRA